MAKYSTLLSLSTEIIRQDALKGRLKWKVTDISRKCRLARSFIYESLGADKNEMLKNSLDFILKDVFGLSKYHSEFVKAHGEYQGFIRCREVMMNTPEILTFYYMNRGLQNELGAMIRKYEAEFLELVRVKNNIEDPATLYFVRSLIHGVTFAPYLDASEVSMSMRLLSDFLKAGKTKVVPSDLMNHSSPTATI